jgi:MFS transporter, BCD family, chlorophyll transporter
MVLKRIQLGLIHVAVAMTLVPINSTLNRVMIKELAIPATVVAILATLPFLFAPIQVVIGSYSDRHPFLGLRRTPYIVLGLLFCVTGMILSPYAGFLIAEDWWAGLGLGVLAFGAWGMGYNFSAVCYLSLASELSGEKGRGKTVAVMWFMMIVSIILTAIAVGRMVDPYTPQALIRAFWVVGLAALGLGLLGLLRLEPRATGESAARSESYPVREMARIILSNRQATLFFWYLLLLLAAILGQDVLLEPYAAQAFQMSVRQTTQITSLWGVFVLVAILIAGALEGRAGKRIIAQAGNLGALAGFLLILLSGLVHSSAVFYTGVVLLGFGTGLSTVANLSLMFDLTTVGNVGLFIGAYGFATAMSRLVGSVLGGAVRDLVTQFAHSPVTGYLVVFAIEAAMLLAAVFMLLRIDPASFQRQAGEPEFMERVAMAADN